MCRASSWRVMPLMMLRRVALGTIVVALLQRRSTVEESIGTSAEWPILCPQIQQPRDHEGEQGSESAIIGKIAKDSADIMRRALFGRVDFCCPVSLNSFACIAFHARDYFRRLI